MATLKESYGFIESEEHDCELFFPFRSVYIDIVEHTDMYCTCV